MTKKIITDMYIVGDGIKLVPGVYIACDFCPCMNTDIDDGCSCNLGYDINFERVTPRPTVGKWLHVSKNCGLDKVIYVAHDNGIIKTEYVPHKIELIDPKEVKK